MNKGVIVGVAIFLLFSASITFFLYDEIFRQITGKPVFLDDKFEKPASYFKPSKPSNSIQLSPEINNCKIKSISLSHTESKIEDTISIYVDAQDGTKCDLEEFDLKVIERDKLFSDEVTTLKGKFVKQKATIDWKISEEYTSLFNEFFEGKELEIYFETISGKKIVSDTLLVHLSIDGVLLQPVALGDNQAFIKNPTSNVLTNELVNFPIGFTPGQYTPATISNVRLEGLTTQVQPTTYYSDGSVRTGILYSLVSLGANVENIYNLIDSTTTQTFNRHPAVQNFFNQGEITAISTDLIGNAYPVTIPLSSLTPVVNGPVIRKYIYTKTHFKPVGSSNPLNYLFTSVFVIEEVSGQPYLKIQHLITNSINLDEDTRLANGRDYAEGQLGNIRYQNIELYTDTHNAANPSDIYVSLLNGNTLKPTFVDVKPSTSANRIWIIPNDGQQTLFNNFNVWGQHANVNYNYLGSGQGFLTEFNLWLDTTNNPPRTYDPIYESPILSGVSLARFNLIPDGPFPDVPNPRLLGQDTPRFDFNTLLNTETADFNSQTQGQGYRFGMMGIGKFDIGQAGESGTNHKIARPMIYYLMSCNDRCDYRLMKNMRLFKYGLPYTGDVIPGFRPNEHLESQLFGYRVPLFGTLNGQSRCNTQDWLGFCNVKVGTSSLPGTSGFVAGAGEGHRSWTHFEDSHSSVGTGMNYYMMSGDIMAYYITKLSYSPNIAFLNYGYTHGTGGYQTRSFGRLGHSTADLYLAEVDSVQRNYFVTTANRIISMVENRRDTSAPGSRGTHPITGDPYPVGFLDSNNAGGGQFCYDILGTQLSSCSTFGFTWQESKVIEGITELYRSVPISNPNFAKTLITNLLNYQFTYAFKNYDEIRTGSPGLISGTTIDEGSGYLAGGVIIGPPTGGYCNSLIPNDCGPGELPYSSAFQTIYGSAFVDYNFPAYCLALKYVVDSSNPDKVEWESKFSKAVNSEVNVVSNNDASQFTSLRGFSVKDTHFHEYICASHYILGVPNARESATSFQIDNDGDGFSEAIGDCNDANGQIYPAAGESWNNGCNDNIDNNCNGLIDCDDPQCTINTWPPTNDFCRGTSPKSHLGDGVVQNPNFEGRSEQCDISIIGGPSSNSCAEGKCVASYVYAEGNNGLCALGILPPPNPPENLVVSGSTFSQVDLTWADTSNNEQGFKIERSSLPTSGFSQVGTTPANDNTFSDTTVFQSTTYYYRVRSYIGGSNSVYSNVASVTTPSAPSCSSQGGDLCASNEYCSGSTLQHSGSGICCSVACQVGAPGLVAYYRFDDSPTDGVDDSGPNNLDGICTSGSCPNYPASGQINNAYDFDGTNDEIIIGDNNLLDLTNQGTTMAWVKRDSSRWHGILSKGNSFRLPYGIEINPSDRLSCQLNSDDYEVTTVNTIPGVYYHVACSWGAGVLKIYVNGVLEKTSSIISNPSNSPGELHIGRWRDDSQGNDWMDGSIDEVRIYDHALTQNEIQTVMGSQPSIFDYSISINPTFGSVQQGSAVSATVTATHISGTGASVSFSANNLPSGVTATFNPTSCTPVSGTPCTSTMTLSASALAGVVNSHQVSVIGSSGSLVRNAAYSLTVVQLPPSTPTGLAVINPTSSSLVINWNDVNGETSYTLQRCSGAGCSNFANVPGAGSLPAGTTTFTDTGLTASTTYLYRVQASNAGGSSAFSSPVSGTTSPSAPNSPTISGITPTTSSWINGNLVTISGANFASNAQVSVNGVQIADSRLTKTSNSITFNRNAQEFNVGLNSLVVNNPSTVLSASNSFTLTANPSLISIVPPVVLNDIINVISINGNQFDPLAVVSANGVNLNQFGIVTYVNPNLMNVILPTGFAGDFAFSVTSGDGLVSSAPVNLRMNYPFFYVLSTSVSEANVVVGDTFNGFVKVETSPFVTPETINFAVSAPSGITVTLNQNSCDFNLAIVPYPACEVDFSISTTGLAPGIYEIVFTSQSSFASIIHETNLTINVTQQSNTGGNSGGSSGGSGGGSSGGSSGGSRPIVNPVVYQCNDQVDNDGDGKTDYPQDGGCLSQKDNSELDPSELVEPTKNWGEEETQNLGSGTEDINIRVVFTSVLTILIISIIMVVVLIIKFIKISKMKSYSISSK